MRGPGGAFRVGRSGRILSGDAINGFAQEVGVADVAGVLLLPDHVLKDEPRRSAQRGERYLTGFTAPPLEWPRGCTAPRVSRRRWTGPAAVSARRPRTRDYLVPTVRSEAALSVRVTVGAAVRHT